MGPKNDADTHEVDMGKHDAERVEPDDQIDAGLDAEDKNLGKGRITIISGTAESVVPEN